MRLLGPISVAYSASDYFRVIPCSSVANSSASAYFRVRPWQMLLVISVAHASGSERYIVFVFPKPNFYKGLR